MVLELKLPATEIKLNFPKGLSQEEFEQLCFANKELIVEREPDGTIKIMSPVSYESGEHEADFIADLKIYARQNGGSALSSSTGFTLPDSSVRSPDASYVTAEQLTNITKEDLRHFAPIVPVFVVEVISPSDNLEEAKGKMNLWINNGVILGWLVNVKSEKLWIYRQNGTVDLIDGFDQTVTGEDVVPGFEFDLRNLM